MEFVNSDNELLEFIPLQQLKIADHSTLIEKETFVVDRRTKCQQKKKKKMGTQNKRNHTLFVSKIEGT